MTPVIERIETAGPDRRARRLVYDGETGSRTTSAAVVKGLALAEGDNVDLTAIEALEPELARDRALNYLGYRERSVKEVTKRLVDDGYPPSVASPIVSRFQELGLIDDERLARMWARSRSSSGHGRRRIEQELQRRGIAPELATVVAADACCDELQSARAFLRGKSPTSREEQQRLIRKLLRRGFELSVALDATASADDRCPHELDEAPFIGE